MASGDVHSKLIPAAFIMPTTDGAPHGSRNTHPHIEFDDTTDESSVASDSLNDYGDNGLTVDVFFTHAGTSGNIELLGAFERIDEEGLDTDSDSFAATQSSGAVAIPSTSGQEKKATITFSNSQIDGLQAWEGFRFKLTRENGVASNAAGDLQVRRVIIKET